MVLTPGAQSRKSDSGLVPGWFRFEGEAGTKMPTSCPDAKRCNTQSPGWLEGDHPVEINQTTSKRVCFRHPSSRLYPGECCTWHINIKVINCGSYYVYYLRDVSYSWAHDPQYHVFPNRYKWRYCSDD